MKISCIQMEVDPGEAGRVRRKIPVFEDRVPACCR
ncbi:hypothetical protein C8P63_12332 [Melghirimyces profundicolus]|uniref:Uncharacterized protein n=1 Tax=Melghirimyces profundicolus TaxID=1242148 RepID=A0A2T6BG32_9BACL|nr:hypothetical protein C8P63_12332 [Melghirimyces profundicolus]